MSEKNQIEQEEKDLKDAITKLLFVENVGYAKFDGTKKILAYFPNLETDIQECFNIEGKIHDKKKLKDIIIEELHNLLLPIIKNGYKITSCDATDIILCKENHYIGIAIANGIFIKSTLCQKNIYQRDQSIEIDGGGDKIYILPNKDYKIAFKKETNESKIYINDKDDIVLSFTGESKKILDMYFTKFIPLLTLQQQSLYLKAMNEYIQDNKMETAQLKYDNFINMLVLATKAIMLNQTQQNVLKITTIDELHDKLSQIQVNNVPKETVIVPNKDNNNKISNSCTECLNNTWPCSLCCDKK